MSFLEITLLASFAYLIFLSLIMRYSRLDKIIIYSLALIICWFSSHQYLIWNPVDYTQYKYIFENFPVSFYSIFFLGHEPGFNLMIVIYKLLGINFEFFIFTMALFTFYGVVRLAELFGNDKLIILLSLITLVVFFNITFNLYRQGVAASLVLLALISHENSYKKLLIVSCAALFHISALVMLPYFFIQNKKSDMLLVFMMILSSTFFLLKIDDLILYSVSTISSLTDAMPYSSFSRVEQNVMSNNGIFYAYRSYFFLSIILVLLFAFNHKNLANRVKIIPLGMQWRLINFLAYGVLIYSATYSIGSLSRLGIYSYLIIPIIIFLVSNLFFNYRTSKIILVCFSCFSLAGLFLVKNLFITL